MKKPDETSKSDPNVHAVCTTADLGRLVGIVRRGLAGEGGSHGR